MQTHLSRLWFLSKGCKQVPLEYTKGIVRWAHPDGYFLNAQGQEVKDRFSPSSQKAARDPNRKMGKGYPILSLSWSPYCHIYMARAFYGERPTYKDKKGNEYVGVVHHLIPNPLDYKPANLLCWLTRPEHTEADRRQHALAAVVPNGDLRVFTYERLRELQDPRTMSREVFEAELSRIAEQGYHLVDPHEAAAEERRKYA